MTNEYNLFDPAVVDDQLPIITKLRHEDPVSEVLPGVFYVAKHQDIVDICRNFSVFEQGRFIPLDIDTRTEDQLNLGETNPPQHTRVRKILNGLMAPPKMRVIEPAVRKICADLVDRFADRGHADMITDLGAPLPGAVIGPLTGLPAELHPKFRQYSDDYMLRTDPDPAVVSAASARVDAIDEVVRDLIRERVAMAPEDRPKDLLTDLVQSVDDDGNHLSEDKILVHLTKDMIVGGTETTTHLIGNLFYNLCNTPGAYERVRADRSLVPVAVEETLRISGPVQVLFRVPNQDTSIRGVEVPKGCVVALGYASANRDEEVFEDPDEFSLDRGSDLRHRHFGFGIGVHLCVGAPLARLEAVAALDAVLDRIPNMQLAPGYEYKRVQFFMMRGPTRVDVIW